MLGGGHYTACCLNKLTNNWFRFDDERVTLCSRQELSSQAAYVLFFERIDIDAGDDTAMTDD